MTGLRYAALPVLVLIVAVLSVLRAPSLPIGDPALFEYYGRAIIEGHRLYGDITDVKLPSIYLVNSLYQGLFGASYVFHTCAEVALNVLAFVLFALILRGYGVRSWQWGTALFAVLYSLVFPQFDYPQHYAVILILIAFYLGLRDWYAEAGIVIALAVTFWTPALLMCVPLFVKCTTLGERRALVLGGLGTAAIYYLAFAPIFGFDWILKPLRMWPANFANNGVLNNVRQLRATVTASALGPAIGALLALLLATVRRPEDQGQRFALWWSACALVGTALPPRFAENFFLPSIPALSMAIVAYGLPSRKALRRPWALVLVAICLYFALRSDVMISSANKRYALYIQTVAAWIVSNMGTDPVIWSAEYIPELDLAAGAVLSDPYALVTRGQDLSRGVVHQNGRLVPARIVHAQWDRWPDLLVYGPINRPDGSTHSILLVTPDTQSRAEYQLVCGRALFLPRMAFYVPSGLPRRFSCPN